MHINFSLDTEVDSPELVNDVLTAIASLAKVKPGLEVSLQAEPAKLKKEKAKKDPPPQADLPAAEPEPEPQVKLTIEMVRAVVDQKILEGKQAAVRMVFDEFDVANVSAIDPKHYTAVVDRLNSIK